MKKMPITPIVKITITVLIVRLSSEIIELVKQNVFLI